MACASRRAVEVIVTKCDFVKRRVLAKRLTLLNTTLDAIHNIRMVGVQNCMFCSGIGDYHSGVCAQNKAKMLSFLARKKKLAAAKGATPAEPHKPTRAWARSRRRSSRRTGSWWRRRRRRSLRPGARSGAKCGGTLKA